MHQEKIAVLGLGLLGTSLSMALKNTECQRLAWTRKAEVRQWARQMDIADCVLEKPEEIFAEADIIILCLPIPVIHEYIRKYAHLMKPTAILTDIGSVKGPIERTAMQIPGLHFIGSHPMAGTEKNGPKAAFKELYDNADVFVVPPADAAETDIIRIEKMWQSIGTKTVRIDSHKHDILVAHTSHVPHVVASALVLSVLGEASNEQELLERFAGCATGFRDTSRIASSSAAMWREIIEQNTPAVLEAIQGFRKSLEQMEDQFKKGDFNSFEQAFAKGAELRNKWIRYKKY